IDNVPQKGSWNMAVDEFLFYSLSEQPQTFLRFYQWKNPTVSLGYSQQIQRAADISFCEAGGIDIVRRMTGGKLVLHNHEITYSLCSSDKEMFTDRLPDSYRKISLGLMKGLELMGLKPELADEPPVEYIKGVLPCFSHPAQNEIEVNGKKIIGSAQKRVNTRFIQHGSIPMGENEQILRMVSSLRLESKISLISLSEALGRELSYEQAVDFFIQGFSDFFRIDCLPYEFSSDDILKIQALQHDKYESRDWTYLR
ncbi:MAG: lipoate--protein ligase family protein, partial [Candidatus Aminicenantes bacterium]|nr:lipoate--protein ligase family protein [Candidatus Aminicenantes bacterium]